MRLAQRQLVFAHFKYHAEFRRKAQAKSNRRQHFNNAEEYRRYLALMSEGREVIYKPGLSCPARQPRCASHSGASRAARQPPEGVSRRNLHGPLAIAL